MTQESLLSSDDIGEQEFACLRETLYDPLTWESFTSPSQRLRDWSFVVRVVANHPCTDSRPTALPAKPKPMSAHPTCSITTQSG